MTSPTSLAGLSSNRISSSLDPSISLEKKTLTNRQTRINRSSTSGTQSLSKSIFNGNKSLSLNKNQIKLTKPLSLSDESKSNTFSEKSLNSIDHVNQSVVIERVAVKKSPYPAMAPTVNRVKLNDYDLQTKKIIGEDNLTEKSTSDPMSPKLNGSMSPISNQHLDELASPTYNSVPMSPSNSKEFEVPQTPQSSSLIKTTSKDSLSEPDETKGSEPDEYLDNDNVEEKKNPSLWQRFKYAARASNTSYSLLKVPYKLAAAIWNPIAKKVAPSYIMNTDLNGTLKHKLEAIDVKSDADVGRQFVNFSQARKDINKVTLAWSTGMLGAFVGLTVATGGIGALTAPLFGLGFIGLAAWRASSLAVASAAAGAGLFAAKTAAGDPGSLAHTICTPGEELEKALEKNPDGFPTLDTALKNKLDKSVDSYICQAAMTAITLCANDEVSKTRHWYQRNGTEYISQSKQQEVIDKYITNDADSPFIFDNGNLKIKEGKNSKGEEYRIAAREKTKEIMKDIKTRGVTQRTTAKGYRKVQSMQAYLGPVAKASLSGIANVSKAIAKPILFVGGVLGITDALSEYSKFGTNIERFRIQTSDLIDRLNAYENKYAIKTDSKSVEGFIKSVDDLVFSGSEERKNKHIESEFV